MPDEDRFSDAGWLVALEAYHELLKKEIDRVRAKVRVEMTASEVTTKTPKSPRGEKLGTVTLTDGRRTAVVTSEAAALAWVKLFHPTEVESPERVRPAYLGTLLDASKEAGVGVDPATGQLLPWIDVVEGDPFLTVRKLDEARQAAEVMIMGVRKELGA